MLLDDAQLVCKLRNRAVEATVETYRLVSIILEINGDILIFCRHSYINRERGESKVFLRLTVDFK
jgi:hypothetical protein